MIQYSQQVTIHVQPHSNGKKNSKQLKTKQYKTNKSIRKNNVYVLKSTINWPSWYL